LSKAKLGRRKTSESKREAKEDERGSKEGAKKRNNRVQSVLVSVGSVTEGAPTKTPATQKKKSETRKGFLKLEKVKRDAAAHGIPRLEGLPPKSSQRAISRSLFCRGFR
jgi:hypothetical protein